MRETIHNIAHKLSEAKQWFEIAKKFLPPVLNEQFKKWLNDIDLMTESVLIEEVENEQNNKLSKKECV